MSIKPIKNEADYDAALEEIERLFAALPDTEEGDRLEVFVTLVEAYEEQHHRIPAPRLIDAIRYWMESRKGCVMASIRELLRRLGDF